MELAPIGDATVSSTDGVRLAVHDLGGRGHPLLVSHATGFHGRCYLPLAHVLGDRFHSVAFDYRGHGDTQRPPGSIDWQRYGDDAEAMAVWFHERVGGPIDAFGHSMGGACLLIAAHRRPHLFRRLVLFEPIVFPPLPAGDESDKESAMVQGARRRRSSFESHQAAFDNFSSKPPLNGFTPESLRAYVQYGFDADADGTGVHLKCRPETEAETFAMGARHDTWEHLPAIVTETLVVAGRISPAQPSQVAQPIAERLPNARFLQLDDLDHFGPMAAPDVVAGVIADELTR